MTRIRGGQAAVPVQCVLQTATVLLLIDLTKECGGLPIETARRGAANRNKEGRKRTPRSPPPDKGGAVRRGESTGRRKSAHDARTVDA